jgi:hypothetical protein
MTTQDYSIVSAAGKGEEATQLPQNEVSPSFWCNFQAFFDCQRRNGSQESQTFHK